FFQSWVIGEELLLRPAAGQEIQDQRHPDAMAANARLPKTHLRIDADSRQQFFSCHDRQLSSSSWRWYTWHSRGKCLQNSTGSATSQPASCNSGCFVRARSSSP